MIHVPPIKYSLLLARCQFLANYLRGLSLITGGGYRFSEIDGVKFSRWCIYATNKGSNTKFFVHIKNGMIIFLGQCWCKKITISKCYFSPFSPNVNQPYVWCLLPECRKGPVILGCFQEKKAVTSLRTLYKALALMK